MKALALLSSPTTYTFITGSSGEGIPLESSLISMLDTFLNGIYNAACTEFYHHDFLCINQLRIFCKVKPVLDETLDQKRDVIGSDLPGQMVVGLVEKNLKGVFKLENRQKCLKEIINIYGEDNDID